MIATVVVLGELERSPRMQNHARALAALGAQVTLIGYGERGRPAAVDPQPGLGVRALNPPRVADPRRLWRPAYVVYSVFKLARLCLALGHALLLGPKPELLLVQSPPALPTLVVALLAARLRRSRLVVDWHNLGTPLMRRTLGASSPIARLHGWLEGRLGRRADAHLCVSRALQATLASRGIAAAVIRDGPAACFQHAETSDAAGVLRAAQIWIDDVEARPLVLVSPTGWTEEEDFDLLLGALECVEAEPKRASAPSLIVLLTGRGPLRAAFERRVAGRRFERVRIVTAWLAAADYPKVLRSCDLGLSLHRSFSGLDPAMKVVDLRGSGLPVMALDHGCVREQLPPETGAWLFADGAELGRALVELVRGGRDGDPLRRLRLAVHAAPLRRFEEEWLEFARPVLGL